MIKLEDLRECKHADDKLISKIKEKINDMCTNYDERNYLEDNFTLVVDGVLYTLVSEEWDSWDDEGKYQYSNITYQLAEYHEDEDFYVLYDLFVVRPVQRSGSYFSSYYYSYSMPSVQIATIKHIPEVVIPAHDEVEFINK